MCGGVPVCGGSSVRGGSGLWGVPVRGGVPVCWNNEEYEHELQELMRRNLAKGVRKRIFNDDEDSEESEQEQERSTTWKN